MVLTDVGIDKMARNMLKIMNLEQVLDQAERMSQVFYQYKAYWSCQEDSKISKSDGRSQLLEPNGIPSVPL